MDRHVFVYADLQGVAQLVGRLWAQVRKGRETATLEYDAAWLAHPARFSLEPALRVGPGPFHTPAELPMFGAIGDSAPDRWGRVLMRRAERRRAEHAGTAPRTLYEIDYLLLVDDEARQGALRFSERPGGPFLRDDEGPRTPPLLGLPRLLSAAERVASEDDTDEDLRLLLAPGSSLGGARPKASVRDHDGHLAIAKFPRRDDDYDVVAWEAVALDLARRAGLPVPDARVEDVAGRSVLIVRRFDRLGGTRLPYLSAMSMLGARDNEGRSYMEIVDALRQHGAAPLEDIRALWRRVVFSILISNTDDHLRNHGFLYENATGWRLSPVFDVNPVPTDIKPRILSTAINEDDTTASLQVAFDIAAYFEINAGDARAIAREVGEAVAQWRARASAQGISRAAVDRMASAFDHPDLRQALA